MDRSGGRQGPPYSSGCGGFCFKSIGPIDKANGAAPFGLGNLALIVGLLFALAGTSVAQADTGEQACVQLPRRDASLSEHVLSPSAKPIASPDGRYVYWGAGNGRITKLDLGRMSVVAEVRAGSERGDLTLSSDGRWLMVANAEPRTLMLLDADLNLVRSYPVNAAAGKVGPGTITVHNASARQSFIVTFEDLAELWEISYNRQAEPIFDGLVLDYRMGEGIARPGFLGVRRTLLDEPMDDLFFDPDYNHVLGISRLKYEGGSSVHVINLNIRRRVAVLTLPHLPNLGAALIIPWSGTLVAFIPNLEVGGVNLIDMKSWKLINPLPGQHSR